VKWWTAGLLLILLLSCARNDKTESSSTANPNLSTQPVVESESGEVVSKREITLSQSAPAEQGAAATVRQTEQQLLLTLDSPPVLPEDFQIGPLADLVGIDRSTQEMVSVTTRFLDALEQGTVRNESLQGNVREELANSILYYLERGLVPVNYRIGAITQETPADEQNPAASIPRNAWMNIRLFGSPGVGEGELYLEKSAGRWYVSDLQIDFESMSREYQREQEKYYPTTYGWGIQ
jgi:hypothetical protein